MSAKEMWTLLHHLPLILGHLIPVNDNVWEFVIIFLKLLDTLILPVFDENTIERLEVLIEKHNSLYIKLFSTKLKPKFHNLIHYPRIIRYSGPPRYYWCFRFEGKHKELKTYAKVITSRKNVMLSIITKFQLKFAYDLIQSEKDILYLQKSYIKSSKNLELVSRELNVLVNDIEIYRQISFKGKIYKDGNFLHSGINDDIKIYKIIEIVVVRHKTVYILCHKVNTKFNEHFISYEIVSECTDTLHLIQMTNFNGPPVHHHRLPSGKYMIRPKIYFQEIEY